MFCIVDCDLKFKIDFDGLIFYFFGVMDMRLMRRDEKIGRVYNVEIGKLLCVWYFNIVNVKIYLLMVVEKFLNYFVFENVGNEILGREFEFAFGVVSTSSSKFKKKLFKKLKK